jgi:hypothetical protein
MVSETVGCDTPNSAAAFPMLPRRATVANTCRSRSLSRRPTWVSQSIFCRIGWIL